MGYPTDAERRRLERFPDRIAVEDLRACFALSDHDRVLVFDQRGPENRLGLAVSLALQDGDVVIGLVGEDRLEAVPVVVGERQLRSGCGRSRRTINLQPSGQADRSTMSVISQDLRG